MRGYGICVIVGGALAILSGWSSRAQGAEPKGPLPGGLEEIVFAVRQPGKDGHWYANFGHWSADPKRKMYGAGGRLCRLNLRTGKLKVLIDDPTGGVRDPQVHYDGRKVLFSWRKGDSPYYNLYEINVDGTGLRRLTHGPFDDIEATYLPDGDIMFCSSRCKRFVGCWFTHVAILYRCDADGNNIRAVSANIEHDNTPWPLPDGRILYTRWEYIDRSQTKFHHLWTMNPDGTGQTVYFGNMHPSTVMIDAKPIPGTNKVLASFSPGHGKREHAGVVTIIDPRGGPDDRASARQIRSRPHKLLRDPYPLTEDAFLVAYHAELALMNGKGELRWLYALPRELVKAGAHCHEPRPIRPRPREQLIPPRSDQAAETGRLILADVRLGRKMGGVQPGQIKKLLVLEVLPKPVNFSGGTQPLSIGGTFSLERILGTVPVEADGSAFMELPAMRSLFFVALDAGDLALKRMHSFLTVMPGETTSCAGCHEPRTTAPPAPTAHLLATRRPPSRIRPIADVPDVFDFPRDIQPILDRHCLKCHGYDKYRGGVILSGDRGLQYSHSYITLFCYKQFVDGRNGLGNSAPRTVGSSASPLLKKISGGHHNVKASPFEYKRVRLWIETGATYPGTYAALGSGMVGERLDKAVLTRRCAPCHKGAKLRTDENLLCNLTRPDKSMLLLAPLARRAGGWGWCKPRSKAKPHAKASPPVFADTADPDYRTLLANVEHMKRALDRMKRFDMPGFRPNVHYLREMRRYGILPKRLSPAGGVDAYAMDRAYWRSLWHQPPLEQHSRQVKQ